MPGEKQLHERVFEKMLERRSEFPALSLLYNAHLQNPDSLRAGQMHRRVLSALQ